MIYTIDLTVSQELHGIEINCTYTTSSRCDAISYLEDLFQF